METSLGKGARWPDQVLPAQEGTPQDLVPQCPG